MFLTIVFKSRVKVEPAGSAPPASEDHKPDIGTAGHASKETLTPFATAVLSGLISLLAIPVIYALGKLQALVCVDVMSGRCICCC